MRRVQGRGGGAARTLGAGSRRLLFDSFEGLPPPGANDGQQARDAYQEGWCAGTEERSTVEVFERLHVLGPRVHFVKGWFQDTFPKPRLAQLHCSTWMPIGTTRCASASNGLDDVFAGGFIVFDDYGRWEGCTRAVDEFLAGAGAWPCTTNRLSGTLSSQDVVCPRPLSSRSS